MSGTTLTAVGLVLLVVAIVATALYLTLAQMEREKTLREGAVGRNSPEGRFEMPVREPSEERREPNGTAQPAVRAPAQAELASRAAPRVDQGPSREFARAAAEGLSKAWDSPTHAVPVEALARIKLQIDQHSVSLEEWDRKRNKPAELEGRLAKIRLVEALGRLEEAFHIAILGGTGSGKTTLAEAIMGVFPGKFMVIDPNWKPGKWRGGLAVTTTLDDDYAPIMIALTGLWGEFVRRRRSTLANPKAGPGEMLNVIWEETNDCVEENPKRVGQMLRRWLRRARQYKIRLILFVQSDRVEALGIKGHGDARKNLVFLLLGTDAIERVREMRSASRVTQSYMDYFAALPYPALLEVEGSAFEVDTSEATLLASKDVAPERFWVPGKVLEFAETGVIPSIDPVSKTSVLVVSDSDEDDDADQSEILSGELEISDEIRGLILAALKSNPKPAHSKIAKGLPGYTARKFNSYMAMIKRVADAS